MMRDPCPAQFSASAIVLPEHLLSDGAALARFHREVRVARQVSHRNVCRVYDIGEVDGRHFLSMEFIKGEELSSLLRRIGRLPQNKAVQLARQICAGLAAAHEVGVLHRDLKPANVMINEHGNARITDFGPAGLEEELRAEQVVADTPSPSMAFIRAWRDSLCSVETCCEINRAHFQTFAGYPAFRERISDRAT